MFKHAFESAVEEASTNNKVFSPQNWCKAKGSLKDIRTAVRQFLMSMKFQTGSKPLLEALNTGLKMKNEDLEPRWTAD